MLHPRSMILTPDVEPLPVYSRYPTPRDSDAVSIASAAPSYRSDAPPYSPPTQPSSTTAAAAPAPPAPSTDRSSSSSAAAPPATRTGLPDRQYAPGFGGRARAAAGDALALAHYNIGSWSSVRGCHSKQYENVAKRRVERESSIAGFVSLLPAVTTATSAAAAPPADALEQAPRSPLEDPQLVGEVAARRARDARLYRERCVRGDEALRNENKGWDFMMAQMADWEERERSWMRFRESVSGPGRRTMLAKRIGVGKRR